MAFFNSKSDLETAQESDLSEKDVARLLRSNDEAVLVALASNPTSTARTLTAITLSDEFSTVKAAAYANANFPIDQAEADIAFILMPLDADTATAIASRKDISADALHELALLEDEFEEGVSDEEKNLWSTIYYNENAREDTKTLIHGKLARAAE